MALTKKTYVAVAEIFRSYANKHLEGDTFRAVLVQLMDDLASFFKRDNGSFDRGRFEEACGLTEKDREASRKLD